jgi:hypothetical protein
MVAFVDKEKNRAGDTERRADLDKDERLGVY